jgi:hypothetical protein
MEVSFWEWELAHFTLLLLTAPAVVAALYLILRKRGP